MFAVDADEFPADYPVQLAEERLSQRGNILSSPERLFNLPSDLPQGPQCDQEARSTFVTSATHRSGVHSPDLYHKSRAVTRNAVAALHGIPSAAAGHVLLSRNLL